MAWPKGRRALNRKDDGLTRQERWRRAHPEAAQERVLRQRERNRQLIIQARTGPCTDCGRSDLSWEAMDLDHLPERGPKLLGLGLSGTILNIGRARLTQEIAKTERVCPTCHRLRTIARRKAMSGGTGTD